MKKFLPVIRWIPALFILCTSWYLSSQEKIEQMPDFWNADKVVHCICFAGFAFWLAAGFGTRHSKKSRILFPILFIAVYAVIDEIHQSYTPGRECSVFDWCADMIGAVIGSLVFYHFWKFVEKKRGNSRERTQIQTRPQE